MKKIQTVCDEISPSELGFTLMHEHLYSSAPGIAENYPQLYVDNADEIVVRDLKAAKSRGISSVVDATPFDLGRDPVNLKKASIASGMNIIATTGWFEPVSSFVGIHSIDKYASLFVNDITKGMAGTSIKAGMIKAVMDREECTPARDLMHRAAARASIITGVPIFMHSNPVYETGRHQIRIMKEEGVPMNRVKIDHCLETTDIDYLGWLADQGCWLGVDRLPRMTTIGNYAVGTETRIKTIKRMIDAGMASQMLLSHDFPVTSTCFDHLDPENQSFFNKINPQRLLFLTDVAIPKLISWGVPEDTLHDICYENPRRFFEEC